MTLPAVCEVVLRTPSGLPAAAASWVRVFDDGVALVDPVTWRTHVLAPDGLALLVELLQVASESPGCDEPATLLARLTDSAWPADTREPDVPAPQPTAPMLEIAAIALHLRDVCS